MVYDERTTIVQHKFEKLLQIYTQLILRHERFFFF